MTHGTGFLLLDGLGGLVRTFPGWGFPEADLPWAVEGDAPAGREP